MGVMNKMRESTAAVLWVLVAAFGGLWMLQDSGVFDSLGRGQGLNVALVDGEPIGSQLFNDAVEQQVQAYSQQGIEVTDAMRMGVENQVFEGLVDNAILEREMDRLGISVSDEEVYELITGETPDPLIAQIFPDGQGGVDRSALAQVASDPQYADQLAAVEAQVRRNRRQAKLSALIAASVRVSDADVMDEFVRTARTATARLVGLRYASIPDSAVSVTDADLRGYYDDHRDDFERPRTYRVEFVGFAKAPSREDSARALGEMRPLARAFASAADPAAYARSQSFGTETAATYTALGAMPAELASALASDLRVGRVVGPVIAGGQATLVRVTGVRPAAQPSVRARHILLPAGDAARAAQLKARLDAGQITFAQAARQFSIDESNKAQGGDLGWFGPGRMVREFEQAALGAPVGQVVGPVQTQFGQHLLLVEARATQEPEIVQIARPVEADIESVVDRAETFALTEVEVEGRDFAEAAREAGLTPTALSIQDDQAAIPGLDAGRELFRFLRTSEAGAVSEPIDAGEQFVVVHLLEVQEEGVAPFDDVRDQIEAQVLLDKKRERVAERMRAALGRGTPSLDQLAAALGTTVQTVSGLSLVNPVVSGFGREPGAVGAAFGLQPGQRSGVVEGDQAAFVVQTTALQGGTPAELTDAKKTELRSLIEQRQRQIVVQSWIRSLRDEADVEDLRSDVL